MCLASVLTVAATVLKSVLLETVCEKSAQDGFVGLCMTDDMCCDRAAATGSALCGFNDVCCFGVDICRTLSGERRCPVIIGRLGWRAARSTRNVRPLATPVKHVIVHATRDGYFCRHDLSCAKRVRELQSYHQRYKVI